MDHATSAGPAGPHFAEIMERLLGPEVYALLADPDVTELYVNPDGRVRVDTRLRGRHATGLVLAFCPEQRSAGSGDSASAAEDHHSFRHAAEHSPQ